MIDRIRNVLRSKGFEIKCEKVAVDDKSEFSFAKQAYRIIKNFGDSNFKISANEDLIEYFNENTKTLFNSKSQETLQTSVSSFLNVLESHKVSKEIEMYNFLFESAIDKHTARLFVKGFECLTNIRSNLYHKSNCLFKHFGLEPKKTQLVAKELLLDKRSLNQFNEYLADFYPKNKILKPDVSFPDFMVMVTKAYLQTRTMELNYKNIENKIFLNWDSIDPSNFEIKIKGVQPNAFKDEGDTSFINELVNINKTKEEAKVENKKSDPDANLNTIIHPYIFNDITNLEKDEDLSEEVLESRIQKLTEKLQSQKSQLSDYQAVWDTLLENAKGVTKNYTALREDIKNIEKIIQALREVIADPSSQDHADLCLLQTKNVDLMIRYKFLIAAILEKCSLDLKKEIQDFKFHHKEDSQIMNKLIERPSQFDINKYIENLQNLKGKDKAVEEPSETAKEIEQSENSEFDHDLKAKGLLESSVREI